jgi:hypothetical protein
MVRDLVQTAMETSCPALSKGERNGLRCLGDLGSCRGLVGVVGAVLGGVVASLVGVGSPAAFFSGGAWLVAFSGGATLLLIQSLLGRRRAQRGSPPVG